MGFTKFSIHKPISRQHPYSQTYNRLAEDFENLTLPQTYAKITVNGDSWGIMNIEENPSKEFLEKRSKKESLIVQIDTRGNNEFVNELSLYQENKYLNNPLYLLQYSY